MRATLLLALVAPLLLPGCGGGEDVIPPFWVPAGVVVADFDGDGRADVAVASAFVEGPPPHAGHVRVYRQSATGTFEGPVDNGIGPDPWGLSAGDFDGDGHLDLVAATPKSLPVAPGTIGDSGGISILRQDPARLGSFLPSQWVLTGGAAEDAGFGQFNNDTLADVVVADGISVNGRALLLPQNPALPGTFLAPVSLLIGSGRGSEDVAVADINGDGLADIALAASNAVAIFYQQAAGGFSNVAILPAGLVVRGVAVADVDGDGRMDIVAANAGNAPSGGTGGSTVTVLRQTSLGTFVAGNISVSDGAQRVAIADLNGDGVPDIAVVSLVYQSQQSSRISVLLQSTTSRGAFTVAGVYGGPFSGNFLAIGDVNSDGLNDIVINDGPSVLLQRPSAPGTFDPVRGLP
jgi:hypothetical protein